MIGRLNGIIAEKQPPTLLLDIHGIGYEVDVPLNTFCQLPAIGETLTLYTHLVVREDAHLLYGFTRLLDRNTFRQLLKVSGIGARTALATLSTFTAEDLAHAVAHDDIKRLASIPGVGKKTAERMILELRGKLAFTPTAEGSPPSIASTIPSSHDDVIHALLALGYNEREAQAVTQSLPTDTSVSEGVRLALRSLVKV